MADTAVVVLIVVVLVLVAVAVAAVVVARGQRAQKEARRERAGELRGDAAVESAGVAAQEQRADDLEREARELREKADMLEERAATQRRTAQVAAAEQEDTVRQADRVDPDVDHRADDYAPDLDLPREQSRAAEEAHRVGQPDRATDEVGSAHAERTDRPRPTDPDDPDFGDSESGAPGSADPDHPGRGQR